MDLQLKDKRALITGSSRGLGYATALVLAQEGCRVAINSRDEAKVSAAAKVIAGETGAQVIGLAGDVADPDVPERLVGESARAFGGLDILITNAGGPPAGAFEFIQRSCLAEGHRPVADEPRPPDPGRTCLISSSPGLPAC